jgi:hypothetical protein
MSWRLISRPEVEADIAEAAAWYEERQKGLGVDVIREVQAAYAAIRENPFLNSEKQARAAARWRLTKRFPYRVIYQVFELQKLIVVVTVLHSSRHDRRWRKRLI